MALIFLRLKHCGIRLLRVVYCSGLFFGDVSSLKAQYLCSAEASFQPVLHYEAKHFLFRHCFLVIRECYIVCHLEYKKL